MGGQSISMIRRGGAVLAFMALAAVVAALPLIRAEKPAETPNSELRTPNSELVEDPFPIRRVVLTPERAAQERERLGPGILLQMPLSEFNDLVRRAAKAKAASQGPPPRLIAASYSAWLVGEDLVGNARWDVLNPGAAPALLPVQPINLALRKQPQFTNHPAFLAEFDERSPALLLDGAGEQAITLDWSNRGEARPGGGLRFDLRFPPAVAAQLELFLPLDRSVGIEEAPSSVETSFLSGPDYFGVPGLRRWKISCPGRSRITLRVGSLAPDKLGSALVLCRQETVQILRPGSLEARYKFEFEAPLRGVGTLQFECDTALLPWDVTVQGARAVLKDWEAHRERGGLTRLTIRLVEPVQEATVLIDAVAPLRTLSPAGKPVPLAWSSPNLRPLGVVQRGEKLVLKIDPDLRLENWQPGDFRLTDADEEPDAARRELFQRLTLIGGGLLADPAIPADVEVQSRRPGARLLAPGTEYRARQLAWWQVRSTGETLTVQVAYEVTHGELERLRLLLPLDGNWEVEDVAVSPAGLLKNTRVDRDRGRPELLAELREPLRAVARPSPKVDGVALPHRRTATLTVHLRPRQPRRTLSFPDTDPLAPHREGALAIDLDEQTFHGDPRSPVALGEPEAKEEGPWGARAPLFYYPSTGRPISGILDLKPRAGQLRAQSATNVFLTAARAAVETRLTLKAEAGSADTVDVFFSAAGSGPWEWRAAHTGPPIRSERIFVDDVTTVLARFAARTPLDAAGLALLQPRGERWRLTLPQPLHGSEPYQIVASRRLERTNGQYAIPLPLVVGAERFEGEVSLHLSGADRVQVEATGLREVAAEARARHGPAWRTFQYGAGAVGLELRGQPGNAGGKSVAAAVLIDHARLTTYLGPGDVLQHHFAFQAANWSERTLRVILPAGARPVAAQADGEILSSLVVTDTLDAKNVLELPVPERAGADDGWHRFEVVYVTDAEAWRLWAQAEAPAPKLPVEPIRFRRSWRLPPGVVPLSDSGLRRLPGPGELEAPPRHEPRPADLFRVGPLATDLLRGQWTGAMLDSKQRQTLADACLGVRSDSGKGGETLPLGDVIELVANGCLKSRLAFVVDTVALREARLATRMPLTVRRLKSGDDTGQPWEPLGLVTVFARSVPVLTTLRQAQLWDLLNGSEEQLHPLPDDLDHAVALAVRQGHDPSGRFVVAPAWLRHEAEAAAATPASAVVEDDDGNGPWSLLSPGLTLGHWTEWEPCAGISTPGELLVVRREAVTTTGFVLTGTAILVCWRIGRRSHRRRRSWFLGIWLAVSGAALYLLPAALHALAWWPFLAACIFVLSWYVIFLARSAPRQPAGSVAAATIALFAASVWLSSSNHTVSSEEDRTTPPTVYLVPVPPPEKPRALLTQELRDRLLAAATPPAGLSAVLLAAEYKGSVVDGVAQFDAIFTAQCFTEEPTTLVLPLDGVKLLGGGRLDDQPTGFTSLAPTNQTGYAVKLAKKGPHKIEMSFQVPIAGAANAGERSVRFTTPRLGECRLSFQASAGASHPMTLFRNGSREVVTGANGPLLLAELGRVPTVHVLWHEGSQTVEEKKVRFREAYLWNLRADGSALTAVIHYDIPKGVVRDLIIDLPPELEVREADVIPSGPDVGAPRSRQLVRLRDWRVVAETGRRSLRLEFQYPVSGSCDVRLELVPRYPLGAGAAALPLPSPRGTPLSEKTTDVGLLAYRTEGVEAELKSNQRVTYVDAARFAQAWPGNPGVLAYSCSFRREERQGPLLQLQLNPSAPAIDAVQDVTVRVGARQSEKRTIPKNNSGFFGSLAELVVYPRAIEIHASAQLSVKGKEGVTARELTLIEWDVQLPPTQLTVLAVTGTGVRSWSQSGSRVQVWVWVERPTNAVKLELTARLLPAPGKEMILQLPSLRLVSAQKQQTTVRLAPEAGLLLTPVPSTLRNLTRVSRPDEHEQVYRATQPSYGGSWNIRLARCVASAKVLTFVEARDRRLSFTAAALIQVQRGELRTVRVRLRDWDGDKIETSVPGTMRRGAGGERVWMFELPPGVTGDYRLTLRGSVPLAEGAARVWAPDVTVVVDTPASNDDDRRKETLERWVALSGAELIVEGSQKLTAEANGSKVLDNWPDVVERFRIPHDALWKLAPEPLPRDLEQVGLVWKLRLLPRDRERPVEAVQVFLGEQSAVVADGRHWLHEATYWLRHEANAELNVVLPAPGRVVSASVDGIEMSPLQPEAARLWLPLPREPGVRWVRLRWLCDDEPLTAPNLDRPTLEGARDGPTLWTVHIPDGFQTKQSAGTNVRSGLTRAAALDLHRAEAQLRIIRHLVRTYDDDGSVSSDLSAAQRRFYQYCREAEHLLAVAPAGGAGETGPAKQPLGDWLAELKKENRDLPSQTAQRATELEAIRAKAEQQTDHVRPVRPVHEPIAANRGSHGEALRFAGMTRNRAGAGGSALPERGTPYSGQGGPESAVPVLVLTPSTEHENRSALLAACLWLALMTTVWFLSLMPSLLRWTRPFWPEQLVLLGALGWFFVGPRPMVLALLTGWAAVRLVRVGRLGVRLWHAWTMENSAMASGVMPRG